MILLPIAVSVLLGFLTGLGLGGGNLMMLWMTVHESIPHPEARVMNLLCYFPPAIFSLILRRGTFRSRPNRMALPILAAVLMCSLGTVLSTKINTEFIRKLFAVWIIGIGIRELFYRPRKAK